MQRQKKAFYIIAHNPNTIDEARAFLDHGVNALEPDVIYCDNEFYICHSHALKTDETLTVAQYLQQLKHLVEEQSYNLALIIFDIKDTGFDINQLYAVIRQHFSGGFCDGVSMLLTHSDDTEFVCRFAGGENVGVGVDESNTPPNELEKIFKQHGQKNFTYADGITTFLTKTGIYENITAAQTCRYEHEPESFKLIYTWALTKKGSIRKYIDTYIDGVFVDVPVVKRVFDLLNEPAYAEAFELASNGYNPFTAPPIPKYRLVVKTKDQLLAGTDATLLFTLTSADGTELKSLPFDANQSGALERNSTTVITIEGAHLGHLKSLSIEMLTGGIASAWLPESIAVESKLLPSPVQFLFGGAEWIKKSSGKIVKQFDSPN